MKLHYVIKFVADMDKAVAFHRDVLSLPLKFQSPYWSEFLTGETTLALHPASEAHVAGSVQLGFNVADLDALYARRDQVGLVFTAAPMPQRGANLAAFLDSEGVEQRISG